MVFWASIVKSDDSYAKVQNLSAVIQKTSKHLHLRLELYIEAPDRGMIDTTIVSTMRVHITDLQRDESSKSCIIMEKCTTSTVAIGKRLQTYNHK